MNDSNLTLFFQLNRIETLKNYSPKKSTDNNSNNHTKLKERYEKLQEFYSNKILALFRREAHNLDYELKRQFICSIIEVIYILSIDVTIQFNMEKRKFFFYRSPILYRKKLEIDSTRT